MALRWPQGRDRSFSVVLSSGGILIVLRGVEGVPVWSWAGVGRFGSRRGRVVAAPGVYMSTSCTFPNAAPTEFDLGHPNYDFRKVQVRKGS